MHLCPSVKRGFHCSILKQPQSLPTFDRRRHQVLSTSNTKCTTFCLTTRLSANSTFRNTICAHRSRRSALLCTHTAQETRTGRPLVPMTCGRRWSECRRWFSSGCDVMSSGMQVRCFGGTYCLPTHLAAVAEHPVPDISSSRHPARAATGPASSTWHVCSGTRPDGGQSVWLVTRERSKMATG